ncbi:hypothetical protein M9Y10_015848 [Tritrichomonas musculus]|uniref:Uncharacterized protein n=1 Tax=Tritrichomonas musculus TaxID=1915356 RepID=A0ABR2I4X0_9EUKA
MHESALNNCQKLKVIDIPEELNFNLSNNAFFSKFRYLTKLKDHQFGNIIQKAGILTFLCYHEKSLQNAINELDLPKTANIQKMFWSKFSVKLNDFFNCMNNCDIYLLQPSIGLMCAYRIIEQKLLLNDMYLELLDPSNCSKFEFNFIRKYSDQNSFLHNFNSYCNFTGNKSINIYDCKLSKEIDKHKETFPDFFEYVEEINDSYPEVFKQIPLIKQLAVNNNLSLVFLCGKSFIEHPGKYSFHLHGTMMPCVRDFNTGFICFNEKNKSKFPDNFENVLQYILQNNPLYKNVNELNNDNIEFTRRLTNKVSISNALVIEPENEINKTPGSKKVEDKIYVGVSSKSDGSTIQLPFEVALASLFPVLFPNGPLKEIPGKTLRKKVQNLLLSSKRYRCGPVAANLILFCFDLIEKDENYYFQKFVK